jgi:hypothetical protein
MKPYHLSNISLTPYAGWKVIVLAWAAKFLGVQMHINGIPFGSERSSFKRLSTFEPPVMIHGQSGTRGFVDDTIIHPDGKTLARIKDRWFPFDELRPVV